MVVVLVLVRRCCPRMASGSWHCCLLVLAPRVVGLVRARSLSTMVLPFPVRILSSLVPAALPLLLGPGAGAQARRKARGEDVVARKVLGTAQVGG